MDKVKRALLGDRKAQEELTKKGRKLPCLCAEKRQKLCSGKGYSSLYVLTNTVTAFVWRSLSGNWQSENGTSGRRY